MVQHTDLAAEAGRAIDRCQRSLDGAYDALDRREGALWTLAVAVLVGDLVTTLAGLRLGLAESNPAVVASLSLGGVAGFVLLKVGVLGVGGAVRLLAPRYAPVVPLALALPWGLATASNAVLLAALL